MAAKPRSKRSSRPNRYRKWTPCGREARVLWEARPAPRPRLLRPLPLNNFIPLICKGTASAVPFCLERVLKHRSGRREEADFPRTIAQTFRPPYVGGYDANVGDNPIGKAS